MSTIANQISPSGWNDARDVAFFRITARLFSPQFCFGATVLLATYDEETVPSPAVLPASPAAASRPGDRLASVPVRLIPGDPA